jgi:2'-5' RNA ligase
MRLFYASFLDTGNMTAYEKLVETIQAELPRAIRSVPPGSHHLTHAFLGNVDDREVERFRDLLGVLAGTPAFSFSLGPPRILYGRGAPRLIKIDVEESADRITAIQQRLCREIPRLLPEFNTRPKHPHVTVGRFNKSATRETSRKVEELLAGKPELCGTRTDRLARVELVKSTLTQTGPLYETIGEAVLE